MVVVDLDLEVDLKGDFIGDFNRTWKGTCCQAQVIKGPGQVCFSIELKFNSFELDSEVGRLVRSVLTIRDNTASG